MAPVSQFVTLTKVYGPETLSRFNMYTSIAVNGSAAEGYSSGDAIRAIKLISSVMANAVQEGRQGVDAAPEKAAEPAPAAE